MPEAACADVTDPEKAGETGWNGIRPDHGKRIGNQSLVLPVDCRLVVVRLCGNENRLPPILGQMPRKEADSQSRRQTAWREIGAINDHLPHDFHRLSPYSIRLDRSL